MRSKLKMIFVVIFDRLFYYLFFKYYYKYIFGHFGTNIRWGRYYYRMTIPSNIRISCPENISIGNNCRVDEFCHLMANPNGKLMIGNNVRLANGFVHIGAFNDIDIQNDVLISAGVQIINGDHGFEDTNIPIMYQKSKGKGKITIKRGAWIGHSSHIMGGVTIGINSVIGANSVVTIDIPDYCVAVGNPARVIRRLR